jgi:hypothetical protein
MKPHDQFWQPHSRVEPEALADAIAHSIAIITGHSNRKALRRQTASNISEPVQRYLDHVHWPSTLTAYGIPIELSLSLDGKGHPSFRYTVDLADHRFWLAENWNRYLEAAAKLTSAPNTSLFRLFTAHLDANPPTTRSPVYHGVGYGADGIRRTSLYFFIGGLSRSEFDRRFAAEMTVIDGHLLSAGGQRPERHHGISYDFNETGVIRRTKFYSWLDLTSPLDRLAEQLGDQPDLIFVQQLMDHFRATLGPNRTNKSIILQSSLSGKPIVCRQKIFLHAPGWRLDGPEGQLELVKYLSNHSGVDLSQLFALFSVFEVHSIPLLPVWLAVGKGDPAPALTFYFAPILDPLLAAPLDPRETAERMLSRAVEYLFASRLTDGVWSDGTNGDPDDVVTARVAACLARVPGAMEALDPTAGWLAARLRSENQDRSQVSEATAFSMLALSRLAFPAPELAQPLEQEEGPPETLALNLLATLEAGLWSERQVETVLNRLAHVELWIGGWSGIADELYVTVQVVEALNRAIQIVPDSQGVAVDMMIRASYRFSDHPIPAEAAKVGLWLKGWLLSRQDPNDSSVVRALSFLHESQQSEGQWLATPFQTTTGERAYLDPRCLFTTAIVVESLAMLLDRTAA